MLTTRRFCCKTDAIAVFPLSVKLRTVLFLTAEDKPKQANDILFF